MMGNKYSETTATTLNQTTTHLDTHMKLNLGPSWDHVVHYAMTQLSRKAGLKIWVTKGYQAVSNELSQIHLRDTFRPIYPTTLSNYDYDKVLESHLFLKQKRDQKIKGQMVNGGNKKRDHIDKTDATSPTADLEYVLLTATINAKEGRDVAIVDIPNAFVTTRIEKKDDIATIRLRGKLAELMVATTPEIYKKYITVNRKGELFLYMEAINALYRIMKVALIFYIKFVANLKSVGFELNPYDPCLENKIVDGAQLTVVGHINDLKVIHVDRGVVTRKAVWLKKTYEKIFKDGSGAMKLNRGMIHEYLGMTSDYSTRGEVKIMMYDYIRDMIADFKQ